MEVINKIVTDYTGVFIGGLLVLVLVLLLWNSILSVKLASLNKKYKKFMRGSSGKNFENLLVEYMENIQSAVDRVNMVNEDLVQLKNQMDRCIQKCHIVRYNAFNDTGSDLSFSIAMLDQFNDGIVLTGIYGRNESFTYAKPIVKGSSKYPLSVEEELVLNRCLKNTIS